MDLKSHLVHLICELLRSARICSTKQGIEEETVYELTWGLCHVPDLKDGELVHPVKQAVRHTTRAAQIQDSKVGVTGRRGLYSEGPC